MTAFTTYVFLYVCMEETEREKKSAPKTCSCLQHQGLYLCRRLKSVKCVGNIDRLVDVGVCNAARWLLPGAGLNGAW